MPGHESLFQESLQLTDGLQKDKYVGGFQLCGSCFQGLRSQDPSPVFFWEGYTLGQSAVLAIPQSGKKGFIHESTPQ